MVSTVLTWSALDCRISEKAVQRGYLRSDNPVPPLGGYSPPAQWSYDSAGQPIVVHRTAAGRCEVELGAYAQDSAGAWADGFLTATANAAAARHCQLLATFRDLSGVARMAYRCGRRREESAVEGAVLR